MRALRVVAVAAAVAISGACEADVRTHITPERGDTAEVTVAVTATAELAAMLRSDRAAAAQLVEVMEDASGQRPVRDDDGESITWTVTGELDTVAANPELTGVAGVDVTDDGERVTVTVTRPLRLAEAIATIEDPDGANAAAQQTRVALEVHYPGGVRDVSTAAGVEGVVVTDRDEYTASFGWPVAAEVSGTITVTGDPDRPRNWLPYAGAAVLAAAAVLWWRRQSLTSGTTTPSPHPGRHVPRRRS